MKISWRTCLRIAVTVFGLYLCMTYWQNAVGLLGVLLSAAAPLIIGGISAYILNILMSFYERHYFPRKETPAVAKTRRPVCMALAILTLVLIVVLVVALVVPQLISCVQLLWTKVPPAVENMRTWVQTLDFVPDEWKQMGESLDWNNLFNEATRLLTSGIGNVVGFVAGTVSSVFSGAVTMLLSFIFTLYLLGGRDRLGAQCRRLMRTYLRPGWNERIMHVLSVLNDSFHRYIVGQCTEALILGALCTLGMMLLRLPYATMIGALVAFTALIPVAGAYIGAGVGAFMILTVSPMQALVFLIFLVILQQLEGNIVYPRVVGASIGLPGIWVLTAVTLGGSLLGIGGMLLAVPLGAAAYRLVREDVTKREAANR